MNWFCLWKSSESFHNPAAVAKYRTGMIFEVYIYIYIYIFILSIDVNSNIIFAHAFLFANPIYIKIRHAYKCCLKLFSCIFWTNTSSCGIPSKCQAFFQKYENSCNHGNCPEPGTKYVAVSSLEIWFDRQEVSVIWAFSRRIRTAIRKPIAWRLPV